jgi:hypothetical protein
MLKGITGKQPHYQTPTEQCAFVNNLRVYGVRGILVNNESVILGNHCVYGIFP